MTKSGTYCKDPCVFLENERLRAAVLPLRGGKTASLFYKPERFELLFQNPKPFYSEARLFDPFGEHEACGFDDAFPTVDACRVRSGGRELSYPDHGEIWSTPLSYEAEGDRVTFSCKCRTVPCRYEKTLSLLEDGVEYAYRITNTGEADFPYLWAFHCLVRYSGGMRLIFPRGVRRVENILDSPSLGPAGTLYRFPGGLTAGGERRDFTAVPAARPAPWRKSASAAPSGRAVAGTSIPPGTCGRSWNTTRKSYPASSPGARRAATAATATARSNPPRPSATGQTGPGPPSCGPERRRSLR